MQILRVIRPRTRQFLQSRRLAAVASSVHGSVTSSSSTTTVPLSNVEAQWEKLTVDEQSAVYQQLEEIQKKDWKELSLDEKKAAYYIAFGPHGPRTPVSPPGSGYKILFGVFCTMTATALVYYGVRSMAAAPPKTMTREWQEASNERAKEQKLNPISGIASEDYKGKGFVTSTK